MSKKHFDYEDDHDWDDNTDYAAQGKVYWYGKYYPKEQIDKLYDDPDTTNAPLIVLGVLAAAGTLIYGTVKAIPHIADWLSNSIKPKVTNAFRKPEQP
jgi:hypothetical protein